MRKNALFLILFLLISHMSAQKVLEIYVRDGFGAPIPEAFVRIGDYSQTTDEEGKAFFYNLYEEETSLFVTKDGYLPYYETLTPPFPDGIEVTLYNVERGYIFGNVYLGNENNPGEGLTVELYDYETSKLLKETQTSEDGSFQFMISIDRKCYLQVREFPEQTLVVMPTSEMEGEGTIFLILPEEKPPPPTFFQMDLNFSPGAMVVFGKESADLDKISALIAESTYNLWFTKSPGRIYSYLPEFKRRFESVDDFTIEGLRETKTADDSVTEENSKAFFFILIGGPEANSLQAKYNSSLTVRFVERKESPNKWIIHDSKNSFDYEGDEYGIIVLLPSRSLTSQLKTTLEEENKKLCTIIIAGNAREGTYGAALKFR
ncbi:MAG: carboxypeptidase-like regulatory domain-containing protein, partial [Candidatus Methanofastidiosia archaeon]